MGNRAIAVLGGGNGGHAMAAHLALRGYRVNFYEMPRFADKIQKVLTTKRIAVKGVVEGTAELAEATTDIDKAVAGCKLIFIPVPAFAHSDYARLLSPLLTKDNLIVLWPGTFGSLEFKKVLEDEGNREAIIIAEGDTLPYITRLETEGLVNIGNVESHVGVGVFPANRTEEFVEETKGIYEIDLYENVLECGLSSANPVMHTGALILNIGRIEYQARRPFYFYEEGYTRSTAKLCEKVDEERLAIAEKFGFTLKDIAESLYLSGDGPKGTLLECIKGSYSLTHVCGPNTTNTRYLKEDGPYGLVPWIALGKQAGGPTKIMESLVNILNAIFDENYYQTGRTLQAMGLAGMNVQEMLDYVTTGSKP